VPRRAGLRPYDVDIGDMNGASHPGDSGLVEMAAARFRAAGFPIVSYNRFPAAANATIIVWRYALEISPTTECNVARMLRSVSYCGFPQLLLHRSWVRVLLTLTSCHLIS